MIRNTSDFLDQFAAVAGNFQWQRLGQHICAFKDHNYYDPLTALTLIVTGDYIPRHLVENVVPKLHLTNLAYTLIMRALYNHNSDDLQVLEIRQELERICGLREP